VLGDEEHAGQVDVDRPLPDVEREAVGAVVLTRELDARTTDYAVEAVPRSRRLGDGAFDLSLVGQICDEGQRRAARRLHLHDRPCRSLGVGVEDTDARSFARADLRRLAADPVAGAGDDRAPSFEQKAHAYRPGPDAWTSIRVRSVRSQAR
jgi:hypothetical protein